MSPLINDPESSFSLQVSEGTTHDWANVTNGSGNGNHSSRGGGDGLAEAAPFIPCDNPRNILTAREAELVDLVILAGILPVLSATGIVTNVINMVVFARQGLSDRIHLCLFSLALSDTGYLLFIMAGKSYSLISLWDPETARYWVEGHYAYVVGGYASFLVVSNEITAIIALERCICILSPLKAAKLFRTKHTAIMIGVAGGYTILVVNICLGIKYEVWHVTDPVTNVTNYVTRLSDVYVSNRTALDILYMYMLLFLGPFVSIIVVVTCTTAIIIRLKVATKWRRQSASAMTSVEQQEVTVTRMLVTVCCVYVVCMTPTVTRTLVIFSRLPGFLTTDYYCNIFKVIVNLSHLLVACNASANFHIYIRQSSRYRDTLREICHCIASLTRGKK